MQFKSLTQLLNYFREDATCVAYFENLYWEAEPACPHCGYTTVGRTQKGCGKTFTVRTETILEQSNIKFRIWFAAI